MLHPNRNDIETLSNQLSKARLTLRIVARILIRPNGDCYE